VQNATSLGLIAETISLRAPNARKNGSPEAFSRKVGRNQASTFQAFAAGTTRIFKPLDTKPLSLDVAEQ